jgi:hypothetical protein
LRYYEYQACIQPITTILVRIVKGKKDQDKDLIAMINDNKEIFKKILRIHDCNSLIMSSLLATLYNIIDHIEPENLFYILSFQRLREIFGIFKMNGFDQIHEVILHLVKGILMKKNDQIKKGVNDTSLGTTNITDDDYVEMITLFSIALQLMRNKVLLHQHDLPRIVKWLASLMAHMYTICNIINNTNLKTKLVNILIEKRITEWLIDCLNVVNERNAFIAINSVFDSSDLNIINTKVMIFRTFFHCFNLIKNVKDQNPASLVNITFLIF